MAVAPSMVLAAVVTPTQRKGSLQEGILHTRARAFSRPSHTSVTSEKKLPPRSAMVNSRVESSSVSCGGVAQRQPFG
ncbi:hypothetical protein AALO_G00161700 [Alosa alosa]|uniref:Uncharacterized protein n=1 Tax=Alosa alosa TaxID=278164 RepID=A0AAV6GAD7_9TELE|nr:hypothetical protein AALO_G00161700 [Alosa alosa]